MSKNTSRADILEALINEIEDKARQERRQDNRPLYEKLIDIADALDEWGKKPAETPLPSTVDRDLLGKHIELTAVMQQVLDGATEVTIEDGGTDSPQEDDKPLIAPDALDNTAVQVDQARLSAIRNMAERNDFVTALAELDKLIKTAPTLQAYQDELTLLRSQQTDARETKIKRARQLASSNPDQALSLYNEAFQIDPNSEQLYQAETAALHIRQQQTAQQIEITKLERRINKPGLSLEAAKELLEEIDEKSDVDLFAAHRHELDALREKTSEYIIDLEDKTVSVSTMEELEEFDKAIADLDDLIRKGQTVFHETRAAADGVSGTVTEDKPIGTKRVELQILRGRGRLNTAKKWQNRAEKSMARGYPDHAIKLLVQALSPDLNDPDPQRLNVGIGDILETHVTGITDFREQLKDRLEQIRQDKDAYEEAGDLVTEAQRAPTAEEAIRLLQQAQTKFSAYPGLQRMLQQRQQAIIGKINNELKNCLGAGRQALETYLDDKAAQAQVEKGRDVAATLSAISLDALHQQEGRLAQDISSLEDELKKEATDAEKQETEEIIHTYQQDMVALKLLIKGQETLDTLLTDLDNLEQNILTQGKSLREAQRQKAAFEAEAQRQKTAFEANLTEKKKKFDAAMAEVPPNMSEAQAIYESLSDKELEDRRGQAITVQYTGLLDDQGKVSQFERAFRQGDYDLVLQLPLTDFKLQSSSHYQRALELQTRAKLQQLWQQHELAMRNGIYYEQDVRDSQGQLSVRTLLDQIKQLSRTLPDDTELANEIKQAEQTLTDTVRANAKTIQTLDDIRAAIDDGKYVKANRLFEEAKFPTSHTQAQSLKIRLIQSWRQQVWTKLETAENDPHADIEQIYDFLTDLRAANLIYSEEEMRVWPWEIKYWQAEARQAQSGPYVDYPAAKIAWQELLKRKPQDPEATQELAKIEQSLAAQSLQSNVDTANEAIFKMLQFKPPQIEAAQGKAAEFRLLVTEGGRELDEFWTRLIRIYQQEDEENYVGALDDLDQLKTRGGQFLYPYAQEQNEWFHTNEYQVRRNALLAALIDQARKADQPGSMVADMQVLIIWGHVLRYEPDNYQAKKAIEDRQLTLQQSVRDLTNQERQLILGAQTPEEAVEQSEVLCQKIEGVVQIFTALNQTDESMQLKKLLEKVRERIRHIREMAEEVSKGNEALRQALTTKFNLKLSQARQHLNSARELNPDDTDPKLLSDFDSMFRQVSKATAEIDKSMGELRKSFVVEEFMQVTNHLQAIEEYWHNACDASGLDRGTPLPDDFVSVQDTFGKPVTNDRDALFRKSRLEGIDIIRDQAIQRRKNLSDWDAWSRKATVTIQDCFEAAENAKSFIESGPLKPWSHMPDIKKDDATDALQRLNIALRTLKTQRDGLSNRLILSAKAGRLVRERLEESLNAHRQSDFVYDDARLGQLMTDLTTDEGLPSNPVALRQLIENLLTAIQDNLDTFQQEHNQQISSTITRIEGLETEIRKYEHLFTPSRPRPPAFAIRQKVREQMEMILSLDPAYKFNRPYMENIIFTERPS